MKNTGFKYLFYLICASISVFIAWKFFLTPLHQPHNREVNYDLYTAFSNYEDSLFDRIALNQNIKKAQEPQKSELNQQITTLEKQLAEREKNLDMTLSQVKKNYHNNALINERIHAFEEWKNQSEEEIITSTTYDSWHLKFLNLQMGITRAIDKAKTGYEDPTAAKNQQILASVPAAEEDLRKHPNDKKLCTVMQQPLADNSHLAAQQIAFFNIGDHYCSHYYADPTAWGEWGKQAQVATHISTQERPAYPTAETAEKTSDTKEAEMNKKYGALPYSKYYTQYVLPRIAKALEILKNSQQNQNICLTASLSTGPRNPEKDAARAAYVQAGKQYCPSNTIQEGYYGTGVTCLAYCDVLCSKGMTCDCVERCKKTRGILFKDDDNNK